MSDSASTVDQAFTTEKLIFIVLYSLLAIIGSFGNLWVLMTVSSQLLGCGLVKGRPSKSVLQTSAYIYLFVLSIVDLLSLVGGPMLAADIALDKFPLPQPFCKMYYVCEGINKTLSPFILTVLSIDRYIAVCHPTLLWMRQTCFAAILVLVCCFASLFFIVPIAFEAKLDYMILELKDATFKKTAKCIMEELPDSYEWPHAFFCYLVPLFIICCVYLAILRKLYKHTRYSTVGHKTSISLSRVVKCSVMVVAFYFICWTPYWMMRFHTLLTAETEVQIKVDCNTLWDEEKNETVSDCDDSPPIPSQVAIFYMYLLHSLPFAQSAFNWLFYAFLNRNLRNSAAKTCASAFRSVAGTSAVIENGNTGSTAISPLWKNLQSVGSQLKSASIDTGNVIRKMSPFRTRSQMASRSSTYLDVSYGEQLAPPSNPLLSSSMLDIPRRPSLQPRTEPSLVDKALSYSDLPRSNHHGGIIIEPVSGGVDANSGSGVLISESSSVEWL